MSAVPPVPLFDLAEATARIEQAWADDDGQLKPFELDPRDGRMHQPITTVTGVLDEARLQSPRLDHAIGHLLETTPEERAFFDAFYRGWTTCRGESE